MKSIKTIVLAVAIICSTLVNANTVDPTKPIAKTTSKEVKLSMNKQIGQLLSNSDFKLKETEIVKVSFTVNKYNEIVVLNVDTDNESVERHIQDRLNYQKLTAKALVGQNYYVPIRLEGMN